MKKFIKKNLVLLLALSLVIIGGLVLTLSITAMERNRLEQSVALSRSAEISISELGGGNASAEALTPTPVPEAPITDEKFVEIWTREHAARTEWIVPNFSPYRGDRSKWAEQTDLPESDLAAPRARFAELAAGILNQTLTERDFPVVKCYLDDSGFRENVWRIESADGSIIGALTYDDLKLLSLDAIVSPGKELHSSLAGADGIEGVAVPTPVSTGGGEAMEAEGPTIAEYDASGAFMRVTQAIGSGEVLETRSRGGSYRSDSTDARQYQIGIAGRLADGRWIYIDVFGDKEATIQGVAVFPNEACMEENVYWPADFEWNEESIVLVAPADFVKGEPGEGDMTEKEAVDFYTRLVKAANGDSLSGFKDAVEPNLTFFVDKSGARDNYWHVEGSHVTFDLTSKNGYILNTYANNYQQHGLGWAMGLSQIPYEEMGDERYLAATQALFEAVYGKGSVANVQLNAVYDYHYCTIVVEMADKTGYEVMYEDGFIREIWYYAKTDDNGFGDRMGWAADYYYVNLATGETFYQED